MTETPPNEPAVEPRIRWFNRLGTRLGVLFALLLMLVIWAKPKLSEGARTLLGWDAPEELATPGPVGFTPERNLGRSMVDEEGNLIPAPEDLREFSELVVPFGEAFVLLDLAERVVGVSDNLALKHGHEWPFGTEMFQSLPLGDGADLRSVCTPLKLDDIQCGWLVEVVVDEARHIDVYHTSPTGEVFEESDQCYFHPKEVDPFGSPERIRRAVARRSFLQKSSYAFLIAASVAMISMVTSRLMTRRLRRLSDQAMEVPAEGEALPGPFAVVGTNDEISALARSMNTMRGRIGELLSTLEERDQERREWIAQVSHDLRTPLTALMACLDRMRRTAPDALEADPELQGLLRTAELDAQRVMALADDLLEIARLDAGALPVSEPIPPAELVRRTLDTLGPLVASRGLSLSSALEPNLPLLVGDGRMLARALENLVVNASYHGRKQVVVRARRVENLIDLCVLDDGAGFPDTEPGEEVDLASVEQTKSRADSSGLGLVVTQRVAEAHGGRLLATNRTEGGASVCLCLPTAPEPDDLT